MASTAVVETDIIEDLEEKPIEQSETLAVNVDTENGDLATGDRFQQRLERFGTIAPAAKKLSRALRFGTTTEPIDPQTKKRRLERFGVVVDSAENAQDKKRQRAERFNVNSPTVPIDDETKQKRINRFGVVTPLTSTSTKKKVNAQSSPATPVLTDAIKKRAERFGDISAVAKANATDEQKAKRAERFKPITSV
ncbi:unnamed protein product [Rotaria socialis]|uniref:THO1-MOS11 C-terminal domain-containing protein n=1 Tax=Rotaria socialis TaxID=392032 RepID=A0A820JNS0_9BILA|nr:unnamed protein product [Rotaria socialis]CAF3694151.1 unnamed protein product [Rotaria socialis]CAF3714472.1 unnamed protein product [Rotaria socialis]CAF4328874.1 unnamed protein product [Rotaria socialis]CAF4531869.1 unnamed protein product [Rotaria socialis]